MSRRLPFVLFAFPLVVLIILCRSLATVSDARSSGEVRLPAVQKIEDAAIAENPADVNSVRALVDAVFDYPHSYAMPAVMRELAEQRLVQAEIAHKFGRHAGVPEENVVAVINMLADKLKLPDYARTTTRQVQLLRFGMELSAPVFMPAESTRDAPSAAPPAGSELSPVQAAHVFLVLVDQKLGNPDYQLPPEEWDETNYQPAMDRLLRYKELRDSGQLNKLQTRAVLVVLHSKGLRAQIDQAVAHMSIAEGIEMADQAFKLVGIEN